MVVAVPRLVYRLYAGGEVAEWGTTRLPLPHPGPWRDVLTGCVYDDCVGVAAADLFSKFPISILIYSPNYNAV